MSADAITTAEKMRSLYDLYFSSNCYRQRYPIANPATLHFILANGARKAKSILDVGCGDGRYAVALLDHTEANITGSDISSSALKEFSKRLWATPHVSRVKLVHGDLHKFPADTKHDIVILLFGVLSHVGNREARISMLREIHKHTAANGSLLISVPSMWRRKPFSLLSTIPHYLKHRKDGFGDITYERQLAGKSFQFFYHLYTPKRLKSELYEAGWSTGPASAESVLPEKYVTHYPWLAKIDGMLSKFIPASLGYGIRISATPMPMPMPMPKPKSQRPV